MQKRNTYLVFPAMGGGWTVRKYGAMRASRRFPTQDAALDWARKACKRYNAELSVHKMDGTVLFVVPPGDSYTREHAQMVIRDRAADAAYQTSQHPCQ